MVSKLVILLVIVLGVVAVAQLARIYELSSKLAKRDESEINQRDNNMNAKMMLVFMAIFFGGFIWLVFKYGWTGLDQEAASVHGDDTDWLMALNMIIITAVFFLTNTLLFFFAYKYVKKPGVKAFYFPHNNKLEMVWTVIPALVLAVIIILGLRTWNEVTDEAGKDAVVIELFSKQFDWTARYSGEDNKLGKFDYKLTTDKNELALITTESIDSAIYNMENGATGIKALEAQLNDQHLMLVPEDRMKMETDLHRKEQLIRLLHQMKGRHDAKVDAQAWDDIIQKDTLFLCLDQPYEFNFRSKDVIHSAYFPHFRAQMNTVPGMTTRFKFTPDVTTKEMRERMKNEKFSYVLMCNKICGGAHYKMKMIVVVLEKDEYKAWMASKANATFKNIFFGAPAAPATEETAAPAAVDTTMVAAN